MNRRNRRGGYVMVLFAMMLFGIMAMAALVIDIGIARLAQRQMQSAADSAAIEGLRAGDEAAKDRVALVFDDNLDATDDPRHFGAGPVVEFSGGVGNSDLAAGQLLTVSTARSYKPGKDRDLQTGTNPTDDEYQVILQRGSAIDESFTPNLFDQGPPIEYLFGRGSLMPRERIQVGVSVGGVGTAGLQPVVCVGGKTDSRVGSLGIAISVAEWHSDAQPDAFLAAPLGVIGEPVSSALSEFPAEPGYLAIFQEFESGVNRVIGYVYASVNDGTLTRLSLPNQIAVENASAVFCTRLPDIGEEGAAIFDARRTNADTLLLAPVSVLPTTEEVL